MIDLLLFSYMISIQVATWIFLIEYRLKIEIIIFLLDDSMKLSDTHPTYFNIIMRLSSPLTYSSLFHIDIIVNLSAQLRILIQIGNMWFRLIYSIKGLILLLKLLLFILWCLVVIFFLWNELQLCLRLQLLL